MRKLSHDLHHVSQEIIELQSCFWSQNVAILILFKLLLPHPSIFQFLGVEIFFTTQQIDNLNLLKKTFYQIWSKMHGSLLGCVWILMIIFFCIKVNVNQFSFMRYFQINNILSRFGAMVTYFLTIQIDHPVPNMRVDPLGCLC